MNWICLCSGTAEEVAAVITESFTTRLRPKFARKQTGRFQSLISLFSLIYYLYQARIPRLIAYFQLRYIIASIGLCVYWFSHLDRW